MVTDKNTRYVCKGNIFNCRILYSNFTRTYYYAVFVSPVLDKDSGVLFKGRKGESQGPPGRLLQCRFKLCSIKRL